MPVDDARRFFHSLVVRKALLTFLGLVACQGASKSTDAAPPGSARSSAVVLPPLEFKPAAPASTAALREPAPASSAEESSAEPATSGDATPETGPIVEPATIPTGTLAELLRTIPAFASAKEVAFFREESEVARVVAKSGLKEIPKNWQLTTKPLLWRPAAGVQVLVAAGQLDKTHSFVVALDVLEDGRYRVASSFLLRNEPGPIALAHNKTLRKRLRWHLCLDCKAESGNIGYRDDGRVVIVQE